MRESNFPGSFLTGTSEIWKARQRIAGLVERTPLVMNSALNDLFGAKIYLKLEYLQPTGAFKLRGAANKILSLKEEERQRGVATFSTGNHGLAVAYVAKQLGIPAAVFISRRVPQVKADNLRRMGANLVVHGDNQDDAEEFCFRKAGEEGWNVINPFDDPMVIAGQGTIGLELLEQEPELDTVVVPLSGGGLISGIALALKINQPDLRVIGVSMEGSPVMYHSLKADKPVVLKEKDTLADSLLGGIGLDNKYTFSIVKEYVDDVVLVSEEAIAKAMALFFKVSRAAVEGAAATPVAALTEHQVASRGRKTALIITGNNIDSFNFLNVVGKYIEPEKGYNND